MVYGNFCGIGYTLGISVLVVMTKLVGLVAKSSRGNMRTAVKIFMHEASPHGFIDSKVRYAVARQNNSCGP